MKILKLDHLGANDRTLVERARDLCANAYAPYSGFAVGAAVRTKSQNIYVGANMENASYGVTMCAEVAALTAASSADDFDVEAIAVVGGKFTDPPSSAEICTPCGRCRQLILEASDVSGGDVRVLSCNADLSQILEGTIKELLPQGFGPRNIGKVSAWAAMRPALKSFVAGLKAQKDK